MKTTTIRLNDELALLLEDLAETQDTSASAIVRVAITEHVNRQAEADPEFGAKVQAVVKQQLKDRAEELRDAYGPNAVPELDLSSNET